MFLILSITGIALISILLAVWSLRGEMKKMEADKHVKKDLSKGRVIFYSSSDSSSSD